MLSAGNFTGLQAVCAYVKRGGRSVHDSLHGLDVGLPNAVGSSMRMAHLVSEMSRLLTNITLSHDTGTSFKTIT